MEQKIQSHHLYQLKVPLLKQKKESIASVPTFKQMLDDQVSNQGMLKVSKHAQQRLINRGILIEDQKWSEIETKVTEAKKKGITDSLVLLENAALIVSAKNNTVITALDRSEAKSQIFTNINGTILID